MHENLPTQENGSDHQNIETGATTYNQEDHQRGCCHICCYKGNWNISEMSFKEDG